MIAELMGHISMSTCSRKFYVYGHFLYNEIFYIGSGSLDRTTDFRRRNEKYLSFVKNKKDDIEVKIFKEFFDKNEAYKYEEKITREFLDEGKKLLNIKIGNQFDENTKKKLSETLKNSGVRKGKNNGMYGKGYLITGEKNGNFNREFSEETKKKMRENHADVSGANNGKAIKVNVKNKFLKIDKNFDTVTQACYFITDNLEIKKDPYYSILQMRRGKKPPKWFSDLGWIVQ